MGRSQFFPQKYEVSRSSCLRERLFGGLEDRLATVLPVGRLKLSEAGRRGRFGFLMRFA
jgi:hypothetical protein